MKINQQRFYSQRGIGIVEVLVAVTIGLLILAGVVQLYASSSSTQLAQEGNSRIQENLRYLMSTMEKDFNVTGFAGCFPFGVDDPNIKDRVVNLLGYQAAANEPWNFGTYIDGINSNGPGVNGANTSDTVILRYSSLAGKIEVTQPLLQPNNLATDPLVIDDSNAAYSLLQQYQVVVVSDCTRATVFMITNDPSGSSGSIEHDDTTVADSGPNTGQFNTSAEFERNYGQQINSSKSYLYTGSTGYHQYNLGTSAVGTAAGGSCSASTPEYCALFRDGVEIVEGVEDFQVEYGYQSQEFPEPVARPTYYTNTGDLLFCDAPCTGVNMNWVDRVRVTVTINSVQPAPTNTGTQLIRRTISRVISIRNKLPMG